MTTDEETGGYAAADVAAAAEIFHALGYTARLHVVLRLMTGSATAAELAVVAQMHPSVVSRHLRHLRTAGLVKRSRQDGLLVYRLNGDPARFVDEAVAYARCASHPRPRPPADQPDQRT